MHPRRLLFYRSIISGTGRFIKPFRRSLACRRIEIQLQTQMLNLNRTISSEDSRNDFKNQSALQRTF